MRTVESKLIYREGAVKITCHKSVSEARSHCRKRYVADDRIRGWQVVVLEDGRPVMHYTQPPEEKR